MFGLEIEPSDELELDIKLGKAGTKPPTLWRGKASIGESAILAQIASEPKSRQIIEQAQKRHIVQKDDFGIYRVPVVIGVKWNNEVGESHHAELEICLTEDTSRQGQQQDLAMLLNFVEKLNESSKQSIEAVAKSAMESIAKVADAQAKSLNAVSTSIDALAKSAAGMMSMPAEIMRESNEKTEALLMLAREQGEERVRAQSSPLTGNVMSELKQLLGMVEGFKSVGLIGDSAPASSSVNPLASTTEPKAKLSV